MANLRIISDNHADTATITASPNPSINTPIDNLKEESRAKVIRCEANSFGAASLPVDTGGTSTADAMVISSDNTKVYISNGNVVYQYDTNNLNGSIFDLTYVNNFDLGLLASDMFISPDGLYLIFSTNSTFIWRYNFGTAWDITTLSFNNLLNVGFIPEYITFSPDGENFYIGNSTLDNVDQWTMTTPNAWDISTATDTTNSLNVSTEDSTPTGICFNSTGSTLYISGNTTNTIYQYNLSTSWDISTATYGIFAGDNLLETTTLADLLETTTGLPLQETASGAGISLDVSATTTLLTNIIINPINDKYIYLIGQDTVPNDIIYHYGMDVESDISTASLLNGGIQKLFATFSELSNVSAVVLGRHNLVENSTVRILLYNSSSVELYDSGELTITADEAGSVTSTWGDFIWGAVPWGTNIDDFSPAKNFVHWIDPLIVSALDIEIILSVPSNQIEIGRLFIGQYIEPTYNPSFNHSLYWKEETQQYRSEEGTLRSSIGLPIRRLEFNLDAINRLDRTLIQHNLREVGLRDDFFISLFPEDPDENKKLDYSGIVKLVSEPKLSEYAQSYYKSKFVMEEV